MNAKHPIDELFAQGLRDAQAMPPPTVWEGVVRAREEALTSRRNTGRLRGLAALLLLLGGAATTYLWLRPSEQEALTAGTAAEASVGASSMTPAENGSASTTDVQASGTPAPGNTSTTEQEPDHQTANDIPSPTRASTTPREMPTAAKDPRSGKAAPPADEPSGRTLEPARVTGPTGIAVAKAASSDAPVPGSAMSPSSAADAYMTVPEAEPYVRADAEHLPAMSTRPPSVTVSEVLLPGLLAGPAVTPYVISKGHYWLGVQADLTTSSGEWRGGAEQTTLNASETWLDRKGLHAVVGRSWMNGWSLGLGLGMSRQRSRFLYTEHEEGSAQTVVDTTWTITPMGIENAYTWDIVETTVVEPGSDTRYSATNTYTCFRIAPEVGYAKELGRWTLGARGGPVLSISTARAGSTLSMTGSDQDDPSVVALDDASLDERFAPSWSWFLGADLGYRLNERMSVHALPVYENTLVNNASTPRAALTNVGGSLRLVWHMRNETK